MGRTAKPVLREGKHCSDIFPQASKQNNNSLLWRFASLLPLIKFHFPASWVLRCFLQDRFQQLFLSLKSKGQTLLLVTAAWLDWLPPAVEPRHKVQWDGGKSLSIFGGSVPAVPAARAQQAGNSGPCRGDALTASDTSREECKVHLTFLLIYS